MEQSCHTNRAHALLSASSAHRWLHCPGSVGLESLEPEQTSEFAEEGTRAHELAEMKITAWLEGTPVHCSEGTPREMDIATNSYLDFIQTIHSQLALKDLDVYIKAEQRVDFSKWVPEGFGTCDCMIYGAKELHIIDLKYGKGVPVSAEGNPQLKLYALGVIYDYSQILDDIDTVYMHIVQPRISNYSSDNIAYKDLMAWAENELKPRAEVAFKKTRTYEPGEWCKFCKVKAICKAKATRIFTHLIDVLNK